MGVWVDRIRKRLLPIGANVARAVLLFSVPVAFWLGGLTIWQPDVVVFAVACFTVCCDIARVSMLPELVRPEQFPSDSEQLNWTEHEFWRTENGRLAEQWSVVAGLDIG